MKWMRERDLLIAQTMAFVQSVAGKKPVAEKTYGTSEAASPDIAETDIASTRLPDIEALLAETIAKPKPGLLPEPPPKAAIASGVGPRSEFEDEIRARVAKFRAHQQRVSRERDAYFTATMAKIHASLRDGSGSPQV